MHFRWPFPLVFLASCVLTACGGGAEPAAMGGPGGMPPMAVGTITLVQKPIAETSEFIGTVRSLNSATVQPQVEGIVRSIFVQSGDRVQRGQPLLQIVPDKQQALVAGLESSRAAREADVMFARQQLERLQALFDSGAISRQELEQADTARKTAEAQLEAIASQIRESRVELQYYRLTAPAAGILGDIGVRAGDRVTPSSVVTTIDGAEGLEAYISVPLEHAPRLRLGLPVELLDQKGQVIARNAVTFIAPRAEDSTQTVLVKSLLREAPEGIRVLQYVRARLIWSESPGLAVPVVAVSRVSGQHFVFIAESQPDGTFVARQKPVQLGAVRGDEYVVTSGLSPGERVIVSNVQKIGDGSPVQPGA